MLSIAKFNAGSGYSIENYMNGEIDANKREDYYSSDEKGKWHGKLADEMGLSGDVERGELAAILSGYDPKTGEQLAKNAGEKHAPGWDCTFSAPKSVSLEWAFNPEARQGIEAAQQRAAQRALDYIQQNAVTNRDRHGEHAGQHVDGIVSAMYQHGSSREGDPQLHTHCAIANICKRPDGTHAAADLDTKYKMAAGAVYRAELASELQKLGYAVERDGTSFRLAAADKAKEAEFSKRTAQILEESKGKNYKEQRNVVRDSRKDKELTPSELREQWAQAAKEVDYKPLQRDSEAAKPREPMPLPEDFIKSAMQNQSTMSEAQLHAAVFVEAQGKLNASEAQQYFIAVRDSAETVELVADKTNGRGTNTEEARYTSREMYQIEKDIGDRAISMSYDKTSIGGKAVDEQHLSASINSKTLSDEQKEALKHITGEGRCAVVQGTAGAGKSYMLEAANDAWTRDGRNVIGCAISGKAAEGLQESSNIKSTTLASTLIQIDQGKIKLDEKSVVVIDEAGMTGSRDMSRLQQKIDEAGAKLVLIGDTRQLQPVDAGGAMRSIQENVGAAKMEEIRRQQIYLKNEDGTYKLDESGKKILDRDATNAEQKMVHDFKDGKAAEALDYLESKGRLKSYDTITESRKACAQAIVKDLQEGKSSIAMSDTRAACAEINKIAREEMRATGMLKSDDVKFLSANKSSDTKTERTFAVGDRVIFLKKDKELGVKNGTTGRVEAAKDGQLTVKLDGKDRAIAVDQKKEVAIDHGYAYTVHKSQGVTTDRAHYAPGQMADRELGYVAGSRHREEFTMHCQKDRVNELRDDLSKSHAKGTSQDYLTKDQHAEKTAAERLPKPENSTDYAANREQLQQLKREAKDLESQIRKAKQNGQSDKAAELTKKLNDKNEEITNKTPAQQNDRADQQKPAEKQRSVVRLAERSADIKSDGKLAEAALDSHKKGQQAPDGKELKDALEKGKLTSIRDSNGNVYYQDKKGRITADALRKSKTEVRSIERGTKELRKIDRRIARVTVAGKEVFKGIKVGTKIIESTGLKAKIAREIDKKLNNGKDKATLLGSPIRKLATDRLQKAQSWKEAGFVKSAIATTEMRFKSHYAEKAAIEKLQKMADAGKQIEAKERKVTDQIRESAARAEASKNKAVEALKREVKDISNKISKAQREGNPEQVEKLAKQLGVKSAEIAEKAPAGKLEKPVAEIKKDIDKAVDKAKESQSNRFSEAKKLNKSIVADASLKPTVTAEKPKAQEKANTPPKVKDNGRVLER